MSNPSPQKGDLLLEQGAFTGRRQGTATSSGITNECWTSRVTFARRGLTRRTSRATMYVMNTKLTLRMDDVLVRQAKTQAARRGKSVSKMFSEFVTSLGTRTSTPELPPVTSSLLGIMRGQRVSERDYKRHLREKHS